MKAKAYLWTIATFLFAILADLCFEHWSMYVLGIASVVFAIVSVVFSVTLIGRLLGIE